MIAAKSMSENSVERGRISRRKKSQFSRRSGRQARQDVYNSRELEMGDTSLPFQHSTRVKVGSGSQVTVPMHLPTLLLLCPRAVALQGVRRCVAQVLVGRQGPSTGTAATILVLSWQTRTTLALQQKFFSRRHASAFAPRHRLHPSYM